MTALGDIKYIICLYIQILQITTFPFIVAGWMILTRVAYWVQSNQLRFCRKIWALRIE